MYNYSMFYLKLNKEYFRSQDHAVLTQCFDGVMVGSTSSLVRVTIVTMKQHKVLTLAIHEQSTTTGEVFRIISTVYFAILMTSHIFSRVQIITDLMTAHFRLIPDIQRKFKIFGKEYQMTLMMS